MLDGDCTAEASFQMCWFCSCLSDCFHEPGDIQIWSILKRLFDCHILLFSALPSYIETYVSVRTPLRVFRLLCVSYSLVVVLSLSWYINSAGFSGCHPVIVRAILHHVSDPCGTSSCSTSHSSKDGPRAFFDEFRSCTQEWACRSVHFRE